MGTVFGKKLLAVCVSVFVAIGTLAAASSAYGDDSKLTPESPIVSIDSGNVHEIMANRCSTAHFYLGSSIPGSRVASGASVDFVFQIRQGSAWVDLSTVRVGSAKDGSAYTSLVGSSGCGISGFESSITLNVGSYRFKGAYSGNPYWNPAETSWYEFTIAQPSGNTPGLPVVKATPIASVDVASGTAKGKKLTAALAAPTAKLTLKSVGGIYPTGEATFTLQTKSGSKWKATSSKAIKLNSGKASYKLAKAVNAATYRVQISYDGDSKFKAVTTAWTAVKIVKANATAKKAVKVYKKASTKGKKLTTLEKGQKFVITGKSGKFFKGTAKGKTGYVVQSSLKVKK
jgi:hypothetical protein